MSATVFYDSSAELASITLSFVNSLGAAADPTTVSCVVTDPSNTSVTHTYNGVAPADIVKSATGVYTLSVPCSPAIAGVDGLWGFAGIGTGAVSDVQPGTWRVLPTNIQTWYIGAEELRDRLGIADSVDDTQIQLAIQSVSGLINEWCGRHFYRITETRTYRPDNIWVVEIDDLVSITALNLDMDGDGVFEVALTKDVDYQLRLGDGLYNVNASGIARPYKQIQVIQTGHWFPFTWPYTHLDRVQAVGTWGWPAVPPAVTQASFILSAEIFKLKDAPFSVAGMAAELGVQRVQSNPWVQELLRPYVRSKRKVGV